MYKLDKEKVIDLEIKAKNFLHTHFKNKIRVPVKISDAAVDMGFSVSYDYMENEETLAEFDDKNKLITVKLDSPNSLQKFSIAHFLSHVTLSNFSHKKINKKYIKNIESEDDIKEIEINFLALALLIPESHLKKFIKTQSNDLDEIRKYFKVSYRLLYYRIKLLSLENQVKV